MTTPPSDDLVTAASEFLAQPLGSTSWWISRATAHIQMLKAEVARLRADLTAMEACKNTYATLAYDEQAKALAKEMAAANAWMDRAAKAGRELVEATERVHYAEGVAETSINRAEQAERDLAEADVARDADPDCGICNSRGWYWGWDRFHNPVMLRCPCVDRLRCALAEARAQRDAIQRKLDERK